MFDLKWYVSGKLRETVECNKPKAICEWKKKQVASLYTQGVLKVEPNS
jgi:hypothetical protein